MKQKISELVDGELEGREADAALTAARDKDEAREAWRTYHLISDAMRETQLLSPGFAARVSARIAQEPVVLAPAPRLESTRMRSFGQRVAAGIAAAAMVGGLWWGWAVEPTSQGPSPQAKSRGTAAVVQAEPARVAPPAEAHDYLLAHQRYSPRNSLQGMATYVRTVSADGGARKP